MLSFRLVCYPLLVWGRHGGLLGAHSFPWWAGNNTRWQRYHHWTYTLHCYYVTQQKHPAPGTQYLSTYCNPTVHFIFFSTYLLISYWDKSDRTAGAGRGVVFHHQLILIENIFWKLKSGICLPISTEFCTESQTVNYFYSLFLCPPCSS